MLYNEKLKKKFKKLDWKNFQLEKNKNKNYLENSKKKKTSIPCKGKSLEVD